MPQPLNLASRSSSWASLSLLGESLFRWLYRTGVSHGAPRQESGVFWVPVSAIYTPRGPASAHFPIGRSATLRNGVPPIVLHPSPLNPQGKCPGKCARRANNSIVMNPNPYSTEITGARGPFPMRWAIFPRAVSGLFREREQFFVLTIIVCED